MNFDTIIAVDGGVNGAIATFRDKIIKSYSVPPTTKELQNLLGYYAEISQNPILFIEKINSWPGDKRFMQHAIEKVVKANKQLITVAEVCNIKTIEVFAKTWQNAVTKQKESDYNKRKKMFKALAIELFSKQNIKVTNDNADALLILHYVNREIKRNEKWIREAINEESKLNFKK